MEQQGMVFGVDIATPFLDWVENVFTPKFKAMHPNDEFVGYIIEPGTRFNPTKTADTAVLVYGTVKTNVKRQQLLANVDHKGHYSLRTGLESSTALDNLHLVLPGDFVYDGFVCHRGIWTGGSGVRKEFDVVYVREVADEYIRLRAGVVAEVVKVIEWARENWPGDIGGWKYLEGDLEVLDQYRQAYKAWLR